jgi:ABC-type multidrug transport system fused ATPase/permease subunit
MGPTRFGAGCSRFGGVATGKRNEIPNVLNRHPALPVASHQPSPFQRVFPTAEFLRGRSLWSFVLSVVATLLVALLWCDFYLFVDVLVTGGELRVAGHERRELESLIGESLDLFVDPDTHATTELYLTNQGMLPTVWRDRDHVWGGVLRQMYLRVPYLHENIGTVVTLVVIAGMLALIRMLVLSLARQFALRVGLDVATRLRMAIHRQTLRLGPSDVEGKSQAHVLKLFTDDVELFRESLFQWIDRWGREFPLLAWLLVLIFALHWQMALLCVIPLGFCWYLAVRENERTDEVRRLAEAESVHELKLLAEGLEKTRLVRGYGMESFEMSQFQKHLQRFQEKSTAVLRARLWVERGSRALTLFAVSLALFLVGTKLLLEPAELSGSAALVMFAALAAMIGPVRSLRELRAIHASATSAAQHIIDYLNQIPEVGQAVGAKFLQPVSKSIVFDNVTHATPTHQTLLNGVSLKLIAGRQYAVVSMDPREAMALVSLLPRFLEPKSGHILMDGEDIAWVTLESLRAETILVGGRDPCFTGTVLENITCGNSRYSVQEVTEAAKLTHAHNFILKLPQGYDTVIGEHGELLDAGQAFRLGLARAILRKPALLIIEEPPETLDDDTKQMLDDTYKRIAVGRTVIFLPSRMSTLRRVDEIVLLFNGQVESMGMHEKLVQTSPLYRHWEYQRFNEFRRTEEAAVG